MYRLATAEGHHDIRFVCQPAATYGWRDEGRGLQYLPEVPVTILLRRASICVCVLCDGLGGEEVRKVAAKMHCDARY